jgi:hypothetical protein
LGSETQESLDRGESDLPISPHSSTKACDADTTPEDFTFHVKHEFKNASGFLAPNDVRHDCYDKLTFGEDSSSPFLLSSSQTDQNHIQPLRPPPPRTQNPHPDPSSAQKYIGRFELTLTKQWQPLPSVSANETLHSYFVNNDALTEIAYSPANNLYYIRLQNTETKPSVKAMVEVSLQTHPTQTALPEDIQSLIRNFKAYRAKALNTTGCTTGQSYVEAIINQQVGACRHRAVAFKHLMSTMHPEMPVRIVTNDCHAFVEIQLNGAWVKADLGGYPAELKYAKNPFDEKIESSSNAKPVTDESSYFTPKSKQKMQLQQLLSHEAKKTLIETNGVATTRLQLQQLCRSTDKPFFYIDHPDELKCVGPFVKKGKDLKGEITDGPGGALYDRGSRLRFF